MTRRWRRALLLGIAAGAWALVRCGGTTDPPPPPPPVSACTDSVQLTVTFDDTVPIFSWTPDCMVGRLLVTEGIDEYWGTETYGENIYRSPIRYDVNPPGTAPEEPARPLAPGHTYRVTIYSWITYTPVESLIAVGARDFTR